VSDVLAGFKPGSVELRTENDINNPTKTNGNKDLIGHSQITNGNGKTLIDWGPINSKNEGWSATNIYENGCLPIDRMKWSSVQIKGVNISTINKYSTYLDKGGKYNLIYNNCVTMTSRALNISGVFNIGIHPYLLHAQMYLRSIGVRPILYSYYVNNR
jgi:hypothetical protein